MRLIDADALKIDYGFTWSDITPTHDELYELINRQPTIDAISTDDVAEMLAEQFYDRCPCNYNNNDEWLPYVCELTDECPNPKDPLGCWKQYIKHYGRRPWRNKGEINGEINEVIVKGEKYYKPTMTRKR